MAVIAPLLRHGDGAEADAGTVTELLIAFCEQGGRLTNIAELPEEEEQEEQGRAGAAPAGHELVQLENGALPVHAFLTDHLD